MDLRQLRYFVAVADSGSISAAASILHVAQSAVSRQMHRLEDDIGAELFQRSVAGVSLTDSGEMLIERARFILREVESASNDVSTFSKVVRGTVRMAAPGSVGRALYVRTAQQFRLNYPQVLLELSESPTDDVLHRLSSGSLDLGIISDSGGHDHLTVIPLMREDSVLLCPQGSPPARLTSIQASDLKSLPIIIPSGLRKLLQKQHGEFRPAIQIDGAGATEKLTMAGLGYAVLPKSTVSTSNFLGQLVAVPIEGFTICRWLATVRGRPLSLAARAFRTAIQQEVTRCSDAGLFHPP